MDKGTVHQGVAPYAKLNFNALFTAGWLADLRSQQTLPKGCLRHNPHLWQKRIENRLEIARRLSGIELEMTPRRRKTKTQPGKAAKKKIQTICEKLQKPPGSRNRANVFSKTSTGEKKTPPKFSNGPWVVTFTPLGWSNSPGHGPEKGTLLGVGV